MPPKADKRKVPKRSPGLVITPPAPRPIEDDPSLKLFAEAKAASIQTSTPLPTPGPPPAQAHPQPTPGPITPTRDFYKRPNSLERDAIPAGLFPGGTKHTYDVLYQRTRGAVVPVRTIQATKRQLMLWADISNEKTIEAHIKHLCGVGLFRRTGSLGDNKGQFYEVMMPEEAGLSLPPGPPPAHPQPIPTPAQESASPQAQKLPPGGPGQLIESNATYVDDKTSFKTNTERSDDDEAFADFAASFRQVAKEITGRELTAAERHKLKELADVLAAELRIAAARTTVSSAPAFLAEHLRRRLWKIDKRQARAEGRELPDEMVNTPAAEDASACPDCKGSGWWYPDGPDKGVAKCKHANLVPTETGN